MEILSKPKKKEITSSYPNSKYLPPKELDIHGNPIPWSEDPATRAWLAEYAYNAEQAEKEAPLKEEKRKEELRLMEQRDKRDREHSERMKKLGKTKKSPEYLLQKLSDAQGYSCAGCHSRLKLKSICTSSYCQCQGTGINVDMLMAELKEYLTQQIQKEKKKATTITAT